MGTGTAGWLRPVFAIFDSDTSTDCRALCERLKPAERVGTTRQIVESYEGRAGGWMVRALFERLKSAERVQTD